MNAYTDSIGSYCYAAQNNTIGRAGKDSPNVCMQQVSLAGSDYTNFIANQIVFQSNTLEIRSRWSFCYKASGKFALCWCYSLGLVTPTGFPLSFNLHRYFNL